MAAPEQINSTITTGGTAQTALPAAYRELITIQNTSDTDMWCNFLGAAAANTGWKLAAGIARTMRQADWPQIGNALSVVGATTGKTFSITTDVN